MIARRARWRRKRAAGRLSRPGRIALRSQSPTAPTQRPRRPIPARSFQPAGSTGSRSSPSDPFSPFLSSEDPSRCRSIRPIHPFRPPTSEGPPRAAERGYAGVEQQQPAASWLCASGRGFSSSRVLSGGRAHNFSSARRPQYLDDWGSEALWVRCVTCLLRLLSKDDSDERAGWAGDAK